MLRVTCLGALVLAGPVVAQDRPDETVALAFCAAVWAGDPAAAEALMTPGLQAAVTRLRIADAEFRRAHPQDKPPLGDGLRLAGFPDASGPCQPESVTATGAVLAYVPADGSEGGWRDSLLLETDANGKLLIADILFAQAQDDSLTGWLAEGAAWK